jgi:DNA-binding transcriptional regulator GbsR (MarR family)
MQDKETNFYSQAHLLVAAIRIYEHLNSRPPTLDDLGRTLKFSVEQVNIICRKLEELNIIEAVEGSYGVRLFIRNHLKIEDISRSEPESKLEEELKKFQNNQKAISQKIESLTAQQQQKKKNLFAEMEKKLKKELEKKQKNNL